jgi:demethylmenaquinone methyltransferase/2-methoxy-6-polyprenyl-1,4-benzoquinol methylase
MSELSHSFGDQQVSPEERTRRIRHLFGRVASRYDVMNDLMSLGIHRLWKRGLRWAVNPKAGQHIVDLAGGTGDVARLVAGTDRTVIVCDPSWQMMNVGRRRRHTRQHVQWIAGTGESIPLASASIDTVTIAFGIRNVTHMDAALEEVLRILKPGGRFLCLEFSRAAAPIRPAYELFSATVIPRLGRLIARDPEAYHYLVESIRRFPDQEELKRILEQSGFVDVRYRNFSFGIACLHMASRPHEPAHA